MDKEMACCPFQLLTWEVLVCGLAIFAGFVVEFHEAAECVMLVC